jgi:hypothetical protein
MHRIVWSKERSTVAMVIYSSQINGDKFINKRHEGSSLFRSKWRECLKDKINELATHRPPSTRDWYRGINEFKEGYQPGTHFVKDENGDLLAQKTGIFLSS